MTQFADLHPILQRQLRRCGVTDAEQLPNEEQWHTLLARINTSYEETKEAEALNERALELASAEMQKLYRNLEARVAERTHEIELAQAELQATNEELQAQSEELEAQHQQLQRTNIELEVKTQSLEQQREILADQNIALEQAKMAFEAKADEAARASQYKSAFLASMSHELRTPLNSLLILSDILGQNEDGNLTEEQVKFATTIHGAGSDLLELINQILDLAKIESGGVNIDLAPVEVRELAESMESMFRPFMKSKHLEFSVDIADSAPSEITSDATKTKQILKNLLSNACKFTDEGSIKLSIGEVSDGQYGERFSQRDDAGCFVAFAVADTGVGIAAEKTEVIFEAFQQADQGTARKYGGTGLGLSISRELAKALGGDIQVTSVRGAGSTFTLILPRSAILENVADAAGTGLDSELGAPTQTPRSAVPKPSQPRHPGIRRLLIVEDDPRFAGILVDRAGTVGFETMVATTGADAIRLAQEHLPDAVTLDLRLPDMDGWAVLDALRLNPELENVPVHIISVEEEQERGRTVGAFGYLTKPVNRIDLDAALKSVASSLSRASRVLLLGADAEDQDQIAALLNEDGVEVVVASTEAEALDALRAGEFGCMVADLERSGLDGVGMLERLREADAGIPLIGLTSADLTVEQRQSTHRNNITIIAKGNRSLDRLLDETSLFLHGVSRKLPQASTSATAASNSYAPNPDLAGTRVLIVDDDPRNVFAIGNLLERQDMVVFNADNGRAGLDALAANADIDVVLMDIMMPEMDGYEAMRRIRSDHRFKKLPILALTALAMGSDRARCIEAGASDYISKPVDPAQLLSLLRVWLHQ